MTVEEDSAAARHPLVDGEDAFVEARLARVDPSPEFPRVALRPPRKALAELVTSTTDQEAVASAHLDHGYSMRAIATHLGCGIP